MTAVGVPRNARLWLAIGLTFIVALFAVQPVCLPPPAAAAAVDHHVSADGDRDHLASVDHDHIGPAMTHCETDVFGDLMAPRVRASLIALGVVFALGLLWRLSPRHTPAVGRDPPRAAVAVVTGREVLARLCISRR